MWAGFQRCSSPWICWPVLLSPPPSTGTHLRGAAARTSCSSKRLGLLPDPLPGRSALAAGDDFQGRPARFLLFLSIPGRQLRPAMPPASGFYRLPALLWPPLSAIWCWNCWRAFIGEEPASCAGIFVTDAGAFTAEQRRHQALAMCRTPAVQRGVWETGGLLCQTPVTVLYSILSPVITPHPPVSGGATQDSLHSLLRRHQRIPLINRHCGGAVRFTLLGIKMPPAALSPPAACFTPIAERCRWRCSAAHSSRCPRRACAATATGQVGAGIIAALCLISGSPSARRRPAPVSAIWSWAFCFSSAPPQAARWPAAWD